MKILSKSLINFLIISIILASVVMAAPDKEKDSIYLTEDLTYNNLIKNIEKTNKMEDAEKYKYIIIDKKDKYLKEIDKWLEEGKKIIIKDKDISKYNFDKLGLSAEQIKDKELERGEYLKEMGLSKAGLLIYEKEDGSRNYVNINVSNESEDFVLETFNRAFTSDYSALMEAESYMTISGVAWTHAGTETDYNAHPQGLDVRCSLVVYKDPNSPDDQDEYHTFAEFRTDAEIVDIPGSTGTRHIDQVRLKILNSDGTVYKTVPESNISNEPEFSVSYPWGVSTLFSFGTKVDVTKTDGGINDSFVKYEFEPQSMGLDSYTSDMQSLVGITTVGSSSSYNYYGYYFVDLIVFTDPEGVLDGDQTYNSYIRVNNN
jgi:hypothetical protein